MKRWWNVGAIALRLMLGVLTLWLWIGCPSAAWASNGGASLQPLTLDMLTQRVASPAQRDGNRVIDLRRFSIDLRAEADHSLRDEFYRLIRNQMQQASPPIGLDLSYSHLYGSLNWSELGAQVPLYSQSLPPVFSEAEQSQLQRDRRRLVQLSQLSRSLLIQSPATNLQISLFRGALYLVQTTFDDDVSFSNTFFQNIVDAEGIQANQTVSAVEARFGQTVNFSAGLFQGDLRCRNTIFFGRTLWSQAQFLGAVSFRGSEFQAPTTFSQATFQGPVYLTDATWRDSADFGQTQWLGPLFFNKSKFVQSLFLTSAIFHERVSFREAQFSEPVNLRSASIRQQADFGDATFSQAAYLNLSGLEFNAEEAKILGNPGQIGRALSVPTLQGNETLLRNLVRNFRQLEQISDANEIEYMTETLRLQQLGKNLTATNLNTASLKVLRRVGFTQNQAEAIAQSRERQMIQRVADLLKLDDIDLTTYVNVSDQVVAIAPRTPSSWLLDALHWLGLSLLLLTTRYGTSFWLIFATGLLLTAYFGVLFWLVDRLRKLKPYPIVPTPLEITLMAVTATLLGIIGLTAILRISDDPSLTLACLGVFCLPIPITLTVLIYRRGRYHDLLDTSYFVEDGSARQLRLLIGRLPVIPKFVFFRDRYTPILWDRRWNWLNYFDFSLINLIKFGFNDIRLRDEHMPGLISSLVWYQWGLGLLYVSLLLWTLSRTIPGLNLLIYFK